MFLFKRKKEKRKKRETFKKLIYNQVWKGKWFVYILIYWLCQNIEGNQAQGTTILCLCFVPFTPFFSPSVHVLEFGKGSFHILFINPKMDPLVKREREKIFTRVRFL